MEQNKAIVLDRNKQLPGSSDVSMYLVQVGEMERDIARLLGWFNENKMLMNQVSADSRHWKTR